MGDEFGTVDIADDVGDADGILDPELACASLGDACDRTLDPVRAKGFGNGFAEATGNRDLDEPVRWGATAAFGTAVAACAEPVD